MKSNKTTKELNIKLIKFNDLYTKRSKDLKEHKWFSFPNDLLFHPDFDEICGEELKWFIWIVSVCSKCNSDTIRLSVKHAIRKLDLDLEALSSMIEKLEGKQIKIMTDAEMSEISATTAPRPEADRYTASTEQNSTEQDNTLHNNTDSQAGNFCLNSFETNQTLWPIMKNFNPEIVQIWCNEYQFEWLNKTLAKGVLWHLKKKKAKITDSCDVWTDRLDRWLGNEKNPLRRSNKAIEEAFLAELKLDNSDPEVLSHG